MHYRYPDCYVVEREKIREYAIAVKNDVEAFFEEKAAAELGYESLPAPLTFISVFGYRAQRSFFEHANIAITDAQIVQVDQVLKFQRPIVAGEKLYCDVYVDSVRQAHGTDIIVSEEHRHQRSRRCCAGGLHDPGGPCRRRRRGFQRCHCVNSIR